MMKTIQVQTTHGNGVLRVILVQTHNPPSDEPKLFPIFPVWIEADGGGRVAEGSVDRERGRRRKGRERHELRGACKKDVSNHMI
jgi:hypothetical protein